MAIFKNRNLFYVLVGLVFSGLDSYDHSDSEIVALAGRIGSLDISPSVCEWFASARTGQVEVNPYWPRGSAAAMACFFVDDGRFDVDACVSFLGGIGSMADPVGVEDFRRWISGLPEVLSYFENLEAVRPLWDEYCRIVNSRMASWSPVISQATKTAAEFFDGNPPKMAFSPNLFAAYSTDFVRIGDKIITIACAPDVEGMLHEVLHTVAEKHRGKIVEFAQQNGLAGFGNAEKMMKLGYMADNSAVSIAAAIEECIVRAVSVVLAGKSDARLQSHAEYGFDSVLLVASHFKSFKPSTNTFGEFLDEVLRSK